MQTHHIMLGVFATATLGAGYLLGGSPISMPAIAQEQSAGPAIDLSTLLRIDERDYEVSFDASVDLTPISNVVIRKIGYGHETEVSVVTTASGTYSSDALASPHVLYPGVGVTERDPKTAAASVEGFSTFWKMPVGPAMFYSPGTPSLIHIAPVPSGGDAIITDDFTCVVKGSTVICI